VTVVRVMPALLPVHPPRLEPHQPDRHGDRWPGGPWPSARCLRSRTESLWPIT